MKRGLTLLVDLVSIALSVYGLGTAAYWYWVYLHSASAIQYGGQIVLQGVPLSHIIVSLFTTALGGMVHALGTVFQDELHDVDERWFTNAKAKFRKPGDAKIPDQPKTTLQKR
jgi:hypothetical protein